MFDVTFCGCLELDVSMATTFLHFDRRAFSKCRILELFFFAKRDFHGVMFALLELRVALIWMCKGNWFYITSLQNYGLLSLRTTHSNSLGFQLTDAYVCIKIHGLINQFALLQMRADISVDSKQSHMTGVQFPVTDEALKNLVDLKEKKLSLVQLVSQTFKKVQTTINFL